MFGYSSEEVLGKNVSILMPVPHRDQHDSYLANYLRTGEKKIIGSRRMVSARHKSGAAFLVDLFVHEAKIGDRHQFVAFLHNATHREEQRKELTELGKTLAHADRIASMGLLASAIAHDINQPLTAVRNYVETVSVMAKSDAPLDLAIVCEAMDACAQEVGRAGEIIRRLRQYVSHGDTEEREESLGNLVANALSLALADGEGFGVDVRIALAPAADAVLVDGIEIRQVLFNLMRNALQAMTDTTDRRLGITSRSDGSMVEVRIEDSGCGIHNDRTGQLFLPLNSNKIDGMGLGLFICRMIVEAHHGKIWFEHSELGGAAVHFTVPAMRQPGERL